MITSHHTACHDEQLEYVHVAHKKKMKGAQEENAMKHTPPIPGIPIPGIPIPGIPIYLYARGKGKYEVGERIG